MKGLSKKLWFGFWTGGEILFRWVSIGFLVLSDLFGTIASIPDHSKGGGR